MSNKDIDVATLALSVPSARVAMKARMWSPVRGDVEVAGVYFLHASKVMVDASGDDMGDRMSCYCLEHRTVNLCEHWRSSPLRLIGRAHEKAER